MEGASPFHSPSLSYHLLPPLTFCSLPFPFFLEVGSPLDKLGSLGERCKLLQRGPRPNTNLVHSKAAIKPLLAIILSILKCMFFSKNTHTRLTALCPGLRTQVSRYQKDKTNLDFTEARDSEWQWHQLGHMQVCTSLQTDNHASTPPLSFF